MTNAAKILSLLAEEPGLDDDQVSDRTGVRPRQQVNIVCRRLVDQGILLRRLGASGKICNFLRAETNDQKFVLRLSPAKARSAASGLPAAAIQPTISLNRAELHETLILIPCSGRKYLGGTSAGGCSPLTDDLPPQLARRLAEARRTVLSRAELDERHLMPAWQRYEGMLYSTAARALQAAIGANMHMLIISGGYGVVKACEPIGRYSMRLNASAWPRGLLEEVLVGYLVRHQLKSVRAFVSRTTDYFRVVTRTRWYQAGIGDAVVVAPEPSRGAMVKAPRAQGEAVAAFLAGELSDDWRSSDGLRLNLIRA